MGVSRPIALLLFLIAFAGCAPGQVAHLRKGAAQVLERTRFELPPLTAPSLLVIEGSRTEAQRDAGGAVEVVLDGRACAPLHWFEMATDRFRAHLPLDVTSGTKGRRVVLELIPAGGGHAVGPIRLERAGVLDVELADVRGEPAVGFVEIVSAGGDAPPLFGFPATSRCAGPARLIENRGRMVVPAGVPLRLLSWTHPFRTPDRRSLTARPGGRAGVRFVLGRDLRPVDSALQGGLAPEWPAPIVARWSRALGVTSWGRPAAAVQVGDDGPARAGFVSRLLRPDALPPFVLEGRGRPGLATLPAGPRSIRTLRLKDGRLLHSNGPILVSGLVFRDRVTGRVKATIDLTLPADVSGGRLLVRGGGGTLLDIPVDRSGGIPLDLDAPAGARLVVVFRGTGFSGDPIAGPKPFAATILTMP